jgi:transcriptional regulator with XRE-family HTH domain
MTFKVLTAREARQRLHTRTGFTIEEVDGDTKAEVHGGCYIAVPEERAPNGQGSWLAYYEAEFGPVPDGMVVRFLCGGQDRGCVRPTHMEALPEGVRARRLEPARPRLPELAQRLQDEREARRMTYVEFAEELHVSPRQIENWSRAKHRPDMKQLTFIATYLGWDGAERDWTVTFLQQRVVRGCRSSGEAVRAVWNEIEEEQPVRKTAVVSVEPLGSGLARRLR